MKFPQILKLYLPIFHMFVPIFFPNFWKKILNSLFYYLWIKATHDQGSCQNCSFGRFNKIDIFYILDLNFYITITFLLNSNYLYCVVSSANSTDIMYSLIHRAVSSFVNHMPFLNDTNFLFHEKTEAPKNFEMLQWKFLNSQKIPIFCCISFLKSFTSGWFTQKRSLLKKSARSFFQ